jgi:hypothetical protein
VTVFIWLMLLSVATLLAPPSTRYGALTFIRATTPNGGVLHRLTLKNSRSTRRERRNQPQQQSVSLIL